MTLPVMSSVNRWGRLAIPRGPSSRVLLCAEPIATIAPPDTLHRPSWKLGERLLPSRREWRGVGGEAARQSHRLCGAAAGAIDLGAVDKTLQRGRRAGIRHALSHVTAGSAFTVAPRSLGRGGQQGKAVTTK